MPHHLKLHLAFHDRIGVIADLSALVSAQGLNIVSMEVERNHRRADVYMETERPGEAPEPFEVFEVFGKIPGLIEISHIESLPQEQRENRIRVVLDNISDWVISIDRDAKITTINRVARELLKHKGRELLGADIHTLDLVDTQICECLDGKEFTNRRKSLVTETGRFQFVATGRPIRDSHGKIIGAVEIGKNVQEIKMLARSISRDGRVTFSDFLGIHPAIHVAVSFARKVAGTDSIICIRGESGTGKELFAKAIHTESGRKGSFIPVNCAALPEPLLESELFGYSGGAFTGAMKNGKPGLFEAADSGTLFLDEIAEMSLSSQAKMLRVIQERKIRRVGGDSEIPINTRIITATSRNLEQMVKDNQFREDLYYRIFVLPIHIPPLRERLGDIPLLAKHFLFLIASNLNRDLKSISAAALDKLTAHRWPGNVRELKNVIERAAWFSDVDRIDVDSIIFSHEMEKKNGDPRGKSLLDIPRDLPLSAMLGFYEKQIVMDTLKSSTSIRKAARRLRVSHTTLLNKMKRHRIVWKHNKPVEIF